MSVPSLFKTKVVGVSFVPGYPDNMYALGSLAMERYLSEPGEIFTTETTAEPIPAILIRNPDNEFDSNAIEVHVPSLGDNTMIGHLARGVAAKVAPLMDSGDELAASIYLVAVHPDHPENPGIHVEIERVN